MSAALHFDWLSRGASLSRFVPEQPQQPLRSMPSTLPMELLRGVPDNVALAGYGRHWTSNISGYDDFALSKETRLIDDFISHDWRTSRTVKYISLCYIYNAKAAWVGSTLFACGVLLIKESMRFAGYLEPRLPRGVHLTDLAGAVVVGPFVFLVLFFHWHMIRAVCGHARMLFVDKLCIAQNDEAMKRAGVHGLAAFLKHSERLVVLWSPTYFSRLWCTYELAAWFRYERPLSSVLFVPVEVPRLLLAGNIILSVGSVIYYIEELVHSQKIMTVTICFVGVVVFSHVFQRHLNHVAGLRPDFDNFSLQRTSCFCCSTSHRHPETGLLLPCDRKLVYSTLQEWMNRSGPEVQDNMYLSAFNTEVRTTLKHYVTGKLPERQGFLRYIDFVFMTFPVFWVAMDCILIRSDRGVTSPWLYFTSAVATWLVVIPLTLCLQMRLMYGMQHRCGGVEKRTKVASLCASFAWGLGGFSLLAFLWAVVRAEVYILSGTPWALFVAVLAELVLAYYVFSTGSGKSKFLQGETFSLSTRFVDSEASNAGRPGTSEQHFGEGRPGQMNSKVEPRQLGRPCNHRAQALETSAAPCLRHAATDQHFFHNENEAPCDHLDLDVGATTATVSSSQDERLLGDGSVWIPFDESWQLVTEPNSLTALGPVYRVDLVPGETGLVIRL
eukprot:TRINITY_DN16612_c1_g1_i1.p1 TRINITY_DN16612_c1_g1~~TRINITY_DN16612_c1_g1_i1.p1  ORF type:complete len:668 (-),score=17.09 TRINITY_DN16612_c1_g1_i1:64-2067(-)